MVYSPRTVDKLNDIAHRYKDIIHRSIVEVLRQPRNVNTGAGAASVTVDVVEGNSERSPALQIEFEDYVMLLDKRKMQWTKLPNMKNLLEWAATKESDPTKAKKLAFATAWHKKQTDTWKPKTWRKKSLSVVLKEMNELMLKEFDAAIGEDLEDAIQRSQQ